MKETAEFAINLADGVSKPSANMASAIEEVQARIKAETKDLARLQTAMKALQADSSVDIATFKKLSERIAEQKAVVNAANQKYVEMRDTMKRAGQATDETKTSMTAIAGIAGLAGAAGAFLANSLMNAGRSAVAASRDFLSFAVASVDAARASQLHFEALSRVPNMFYQIKKEGGAGVVAAINAVAQQSSIGRDKLTGFAEKLQAVGIRGQALQQALRGMSLYALAGKEDLFLARVQTARLLGVSIDKLSKDAQARFGDIDKAARLGIGNQLARLRDNFGQLFANLKIDGLLESFDKLVSMFSLSTVQGQGLKSLIEGLLGPLGDDINGTTPLFKEMFEQGLIAALKLQLAFLDLRDSVHGWLDSIDKSDLDDLRVAFDVIRGAAFGVIASFSLMGVAVYSVFAGIKTGVKTFAEELATGGRGAALNLIVAFAHGLESGLSTVVSSVRKLGTTAIQTLASVLQIRSPSRVALNMGAYVGEGYALGLQGSEARVEQATQAMISVPQRVDMAPISMPPATPAPRGNVTVNLERIEIHAASGEPDDIQYAVERALALFLQRAQLELGAAT